MPEPVPVVSRNLAAASKRKNYNFGDAPSLRPSQLFYD